MKNGFTKFQNEIIYNVEQKMAEGDTFDDAAMYAAHDLAITELYVKETYVSYKTMMVVTK